MLTLSYRRAEVAGFWILGTILVWLAIGLAAAAAGSRARWDWATVAAVLLVLPGLVWRPWFETGVWAWNGAVRRIAGGLRKCVLAAGYYILLAPVSRSVSSTRAPYPPDSSGWRVRAARPDHARSPASERASGDQGLGAFVQVPGNGWAVALVPIVFLLALLRDDPPQNAAPGSTYTLY